MRKNGIAQTVDHERQNTRTAASTPLSTSSWRTSRARPAPIASRMAISRRRVRGTTEQQAGDVRAGNEQEHGGCAASSIKARRVTTSIRASFSVMSRGRELVLRRVGLARLLRMDPRAEDREFRACRVDRDIAVAAVQ